MKMILGACQADSLFAPLSDSDNTMSQSPDTDGDEDCGGDKRHRTDNMRFKCFECDKTLLRQ